MSKDLYDKLKEYSKSDFYPFHMPGHKRNVNLIKEQYGIDIDITEIDGFDMLYEADDVLKVRWNGKKILGDGKNIFFSKWKHSWHFNSNAFVSYTGG